MKDLMLCVDEYHGDIITDVDGLLAAATYGDDTQIRRRLAERLVLCWNSCRGLTDDEVGKLRADAERLRAAIRRALADSESGTGWGPDVTVCAYLHEALTPNAAVSGYQQTAKPDVGRRA